MCSDLYNFLKRIVFFFEHKEDKNTGCESEVIDLIMIETSWKIQF